LTGLLYRGQFYGTFAGGNIARLINPRFRRVVRDLSCPMSGLARSDAICDLSSEPFSDAKVRVIVS
jgi:hypothetical protein